MWQVLLGGRKHAGKAPRRSMWKTMESRNPRGKSAKGGRAANASPRHASARHDVGGGGTQLVAHQFGGSHESPSTLSASYI